MEWIETKGRPKTIALSCDSTILIFGGPYSNLQASEAVLDEAARLNIPASSVICTGDLAAYCASPAETIDLIRRSGVHVVMGNCDEQLALEADDCGCGFPSGSACERLSAAWFAFARAKVDEDQRKWLARLPRRIDLIIGGRRLAVVHATVSEINRFVFASTPSDVKQAELELSGCDGVIAGHCGLPFTEVIEARLWHNAGVIGMPANDGTTSGWYSLLIPEGETIRIEHRALSYDHAAAQAAMLDADLPPEYRLALATGLWPSLDILTRQEKSVRGRKLIAGSVLWPAQKDGVLWPRHKPLKGTTIQQTGAARKPPRQKFTDINWTATGQKRATVPLRALETIWFNTGTLCNIACANCYIESSPKNDRLAYLTLADVKPYLDEIKRSGEPVALIGFTGGEPFMNKEFVSILRETLQRGFQTLTLTNAMKPMTHKRAEIARLAQVYGASMRMRVSLDDFRAEIHDKERGAGSFNQTLMGLIWLSKAGICLEVAGRRLEGDPDAMLRAGYAELFAKHGIDIDCADPQALLILPEMEKHGDPPEITEACWKILGKTPDQVMCSNARMIVKRKGDPVPSVLACTLVPYDDRFVLGRTLAEAKKPIPLAHPYCASFCVLGGGSCGSLRA